MENQLHLERAVSGDGGWSEARPPERLLRLAPNALQINLARYIADLVYP